MNRDQRRRAKKMQARLPIPAQAVLVFRCPGSGGLHAPSPGPCGASIGVAIHSDAGLSVAALMKALQVEGWELAALEPAGTVPMPMEPLCKDCCGKILADIPAMGGG